MTEYTKKDLNGIARQEAKTVSQITARPAKYSYWILALSTHGPTLKVWIEAYDGPRLRCVAI